MKILNNSETYVNGQLVKVTRILISPQDDHPLSERAKIILASAKGGDNLTIEMDWETNPPTQYVASVN